MINNHFRIMLYIHCTLCSKLSCLFFVIRANRKLIYTMKISQLTAVYIYKTSPLNFALAVSRAPVMETYGTDGAGVWARFKGGHGVYCSFLLLDFKGLSFTFYLEILLCMGDYSLYKCTCVCTLKVGSQYDAKGSVALLFLVCVNWNVLACAMRHDANECKDRLEFYLCINCVMFDQSHCSTFHVIMLLLLFFFFVDDTARSKTNLNSSSFSSSSYPIDLTASAVGGVILYSSRFNAQPLRMHIARYSEPH